MEILSFFNWWIQFNSERESSSSSYLHERLDDLICKEMNTCDGSCGNKKNDDNEDDVYVQSIEGLLMKYVHVANHDLKHATRIAFRHFSDTRQKDDNPSSNADELALDKGDILELHRFAIEAIKLLQQQKDLYHKTSISEDRERGLRIIATSR